MIIAEPQSILYKSGYHLVHAALQDKFFNNIQFQIFRGCADLLHLNYIALSFRRNFGFCIE